MQRVRTEFMQAAHVEDRHPLSRTDPLVDERRRAQVASHPMNQHRKQEERRALQQRISARRTEQRPKYGWAIDQRLDPLGTRSGRSDRIGGVG